MLEERTMEMWKMAKAILDRQTLRMRQEAEIKTWRFSLGYGQQGHWRTSMLDACR